MTILLKEALGVHRANTDIHSLAKSFGDGFLIRHNSLYRNIRAAFLKHGYRFSQNNPIEVVPWLSLPQTLEKKSLSLIDNVTPLRSLERKSPRNIRLNDLHALMFRKNFLLHEMSHCVAHSLVFGEKKLLGLGATQENVLKILLCESFANTVEALACGEVGDEMHRSFLRLGSYSECRNDDIDAARNSEFKILFFAFLFRNFLFDSLDNRSIARALSVARLGSKEDVLSARRLFNAVKLPLDFRLHTSQAYFRFLGFEEVLSELFDFDFIGTLSESPKLLRAIDSLEKLVVTRNTETRCVTYAH
jgi:hypothetical protein